MWISKGWSARLGGRLFLKGTRRSVRLPDPDWRRRTPIESGYFTLLQLEIAGVDEPAGLHDPVIS